jgi:putative transposase
MELLEPHMPTPKGYGRPRIHNPREILDPIFYVLRSGCQWRLLPHDFPRWPTVYYYFRKWRIDGTWERINRAIREPPRDSLRDERSSTLDDDTKRYQADTGPHPGEQRALVS